MATKMSGEPARTPWARGAGWELCIQKQLAQRRPRRSSPVSLKARSQHCSSCGNMALREG